MAKAKTRLGKAEYVERGYGQVEPNHLSAPRNGQVYGQLPAVKTLTLLENGQFVCYDYAAGVCDLTGNGPWMMVYNEVKLYEDYQGDADFAMIADNYTANTYDATGTNMPEGSVMTPRVFKMSVGDIFTTNTIKENAELTVGQTLKVDTATGYLSKDGTVGPEFKVVKVYTTPDLQRGVKLQCIAE